MIHLEWVVIVPALIAVMWILPSKLERRDAALSIAWPRDPIPEHGRIVTIRHSPEEIERYVIQEGRPEDRGSLLIAPQADIYYEALFHKDEDTGEVNCSKAFVILPGSHTQTFIYHDLIDRMHKELGFCTLVFDWRSHGRSEDSPGDMTSELFMLDAAALIDTVFPDQPVHIFGWSLGGAVAYQLAIYKPQLVKSMIVYASSACFGPIPEDSTECVAHVDFLGRFFSSSVMMRLIGLSNEFELSKSALKAREPFSELYEKMFKTLRMDQKVKTPRMWLKIQGVKTFGQLDKILCPFQQIAGIHEFLTSKHSMELEASRISKAEPPIVLEDPTGRGYSHMALLEEGGLDLIMQHLAAFYKKHA
jgi:pimeloyl-ACP methyl ester carboxylesterase